VKDAFLFFILVKNTIFVQIKIDKNIDLIPHAVCMQNMKIQPFVDPEKLCLQKVCH